MEATPSAVAQASASSRVAVVGSLNLDYTFALHHRPSPGETVLARSVSWSPGGKGGNQAVAAARAGAEVTMIGCLGNDAAGRRLRAELVRRSVATDGIGATGKASTGAAFVTVTPDGENAIVVHSGANLHLGEREIDRQRGAIERADVLCLQLEIPLSSVERAARIARDAGTLVVLNLAPAIATARQLLALADVAVANQAETTVFVKQRMDGPAVAAAALRELGASAVILTLGAGGVFVLARNGESDLIDTASVGGPVVDTTGAGDTFVGHLAARLAHGDELIPAAASAVVAASASTTHFGAQAVIDAPTELDLR